MIARWTPSGWSAAGAPLGCKAGQDVSGNLVEASKEGSAAMRANQESNRMWPTAMSVPNAPLTHNWAVWGVWHADPYGFVELCTRVINALGPGANLQIHAQLRSLDPPLEFR
jgi:hypothetical protein